MVTSWDVSQQDEYSSTQIVNDPLAVIYNENTWKINKVSPLYNLLYTKVKLKQYASRIRRDLATTSAVDSSVTYSVNIEPQPLLKYDETDAAAIMITISPSSNSNKSKKNSYTCLLLSWGQSIHVQNTVHLPYLIEIGEQRISTSVKTSLQNLFDCNISQYNFTQLQLLKFAFTFIENDTSRNTDTFLLSYVIPNTDLKNKLRIDLNIEDIRFLWNGAKMEASESGDIVKSAYELLQRQIEHTILINVSALNLIEISLPKADVRCDGIVKMKTPEIVNSVFSLLNEINNIC